MSLIRYAILSLLLTTLLRISAGDDKGYSYRITQKFPLGKSAIKKMQDYYSVTLPSDIQSLIVFTANEDQSRGFAVFEDKMLPVFFAQTLYNDKEFFWLGSKGPTHMYVRMSDLNYKLAETDPDIYALAHDGGVTLYAACIPSSSGGRECFIKKENGGYFNVIGKGENDIAEVMDDGDVELFILEVQ
jgi:hypothetical protein